jgi:hypothetical protein
MAKNADYEVVWLPMKEELRSKLNIKKAWKFFNEHNGKPYGFKSKLFTIIDTEEDNYFTPFSAESITFIAKYIELLLPNEYKSYLEEGLH